MIEAYEVNVRIGRDDVERDGMRALSGFPPMSGFLGYEDATSWAKKPSSYVAIHAHVRHTGFAPQKLRPVSEKR